MQLLLVYILPLKYSKLCRRRYLDSQFFLNYYITKLSLHAKLNELNLDQPLDIEPSSKELSSCLHQCCFPVMTWSILTLTSWSQFSFPSIISTNIPVFCIMFISGDHHMGGTSPDGGKPAEATDNGKDYLPTYVPECLAGSWATEILWWGQVTAHIPCSTFHKNHFCLSSPDSPLDIG